MKTVQDVLTTKGSDVHSLSPGATVFEALQLMADKNIGAVLVMEGGRSVGLFTEREYARQIILLGKNSRGTLLRDVMIQRVRCVRPTQTLEDCLAIMSSPPRIRHLPVLLGGQVHGLLSIGDVVAGIISEREFAIEQLEEYITG